MPAVISCTQALGTPRYPTLKGIMAARSRQITTLSVADLGGDLLPAGGQWPSRVVAVQPPPSRAAGRTVTGAPADAAREIADFLADRRLI
jgi:electron transfer flavoprotein beta subunit